MKKKAPLLGRPPIGDQRKIQLSIALSPAVIRKVERQKHGDSRSITVEKLLWKALEADK